MSDLNDFNESQGQVVDAPETEEVTSEVIEETPNEEVAIPQPPEVNHQFAEFRKTTQAEIDRLAREVQQKEELVNLLFETGYKGEINPHTQKPIEAVEDFIAWKEEDDRKQLEKAGLPPDYIDKAIANNPVIQQAAAIIQHNQQIQTTMAVDTELAKIQVINPKIKTLKELADDRKNDEVYNALVKGGMSLSKAYETVTKNPQRKPDETKNHLQSLGGGNAGNVTDVTPEEMKQFQKFNPKVTKDEVIAWKKSHGGKK